MGASISWIVVVCVCVKLFKNMHLGILWGGTIRGLRAMCVSECLLVVCIGYQKQIFCCVWFAQIFLTSRA